MTTGAVRPPGAVITLCRPAALRMRDHGNDRGCAEQVVVDMNNSVIEEQLRCLLLQATRHSCGNNLILYYIVLLSQYFATTSLVRRIQREFYL